MFRILDPVPEMDVRARRTVYGEYVKQHSELARVQVGCHNDMVMLEKDPKTEEAVAVLMATGAPGDPVIFPLHLHTKGEQTVCLEGTYGEYLDVGENPDDLFEGSLTLAEFQQQHPGVVTLLEPDGDRIPVHLGPGAVWAIGDNTQHKPFGVIGDGGMLMAQIHWGGPNKILE
jgi:hypothetical protein